MASLRLYKCVYSVVLRVCVCVIRHDTDNTTTTTIPAAITTTQTKQTVRSSMGDLRFAARLLLLLCALHENDHNTHKHVYKVEEEREGVEHKVVVPRVCPLHDQLGVKDDETAK